MPLSRPSNKDLFIYKFVNTNKGTLNYKWCVIENKKNKSYFNKRKHLKNNVFCIFLKQWSSAGPLRTMIQRGSQFSLFNF